MSPLISFIIPSRYPDHVRAFFDNITQTAKHPERIEVLIKFDDDQLAYKDWIEEESKSRPFKIIAIFTPRLEGIYSGAIAVEQLFHLSSPDSYFVQIMSDEPRFLTMHWDTILEKYQHFHTDDIFRLRLSVFKFKTYTSHYECTHQPDSFPIYTRRWLELTEGTGDCWGSDAYQQCIAFHLALGEKSYFNYFSENSVSRDIPLLDIQMEGLEFGVGVSASAQVQRDRRNHREWNRLTTHIAQEHFSYLARRINAAIYAHQIGLSEFTLKNRSSFRVIQLLDSKHKVIKEFSYAVPRFPVYCANFTRQLFTLPRLFISRQLKNHQIKTIQTDSKPTPRLTTKSLRQLSDSFFVILRRALSPIHVIMIAIEKTLSRDRPGISMLASNRPDLAIGVKKPTNEHIEWLKMELSQQEKHQEALRNKSFTVPHRDTYNVLGNGETFKKSS